MYNVSDNRTVVTWAGARKAAALPTARIVPTALTSGASGAMKSLHQ